MAPSFCFIFSTILIFASVLNLTGSTRRKCKRVCGKFKETSNARDKILGRAGGRMWSKDGSYERPEEDPIKMRVIHGYEPPLRGFMVKVKAYHPDDPDYDLAKCGGSLINNKYVLTAAHCVCLLHSEAVPCEDGKIQYDFKKVIKVYLGLHPHDDALEKTKHGSSKYERSVSRIKIHPTWKGSEMDEPFGVDLALLKLAVKIKRWTRLVKPICLPGVWKKPHPVEDQVAYVAGWGATEKQRRNCFTDNRGPDRNVRCRFPFRFLDFEYENENCIKHTSGFPSLYNKKCEQFRKERPNFDWSQFSYVKILYNRSAKSTKCYTMSLVKDFGWCGTCIAGAKVGEEGFCSEQMHDNMASSSDSRTDEENVEDDVMDAEITISRPGKNWGYCSADCGDIQNQEQDTSRLKETQITILTKEQCMLLINNSTSEFYPETELCAGMKFKFPKFTVYNRKFDRRRSRRGGKKVYKFKYLGVREDKLNVLEEHKDLGFYLGFSDSCQGDSGGPLYQFVGKKVYQSGLVSRGGQCGGQNDPGIYTSIANKPVMDWIIKNSKSGSC